MTDSYPLKGVGAKVSHFKCFGEQPAGFDVFCRINVIIGRNNSGKSALIDLLELCISKGNSFVSARHGRGAQLYGVQVQQELDELSLRRIFPDQTRGGGIPGNNHWQFGEQFIGHEITRRFGPGWTGSLLDGPPFDQLSTEYRSTYRNRLVAEVTSPFEDLQLIRISAERDIRPETRSMERTVDPSGGGATNLIRAFINSDDLPREEVETSLLKDLNTVYRGDAEFEEIICQEDENGTWEIFLKEASKGYIRLSESGSSLKSAFIVLCTLRLVPLIQNVDWERTILAVEEPENNLHPALLRRLLSFLAKQSEEKGFSLFITTHSSVCIDWSSRASDSQIIHVQHDGENSLCSTASGYIDNRNILDDLDFRASDILQANGIIWVEGPSDRIYLRRWIELATEGRLIEGVHYSIMFYGGKMLSHLDSLPPDEGEELISLLSINRNSAVVIDSDRRPRIEGGPRPRMNINQTKQRVRKEVEEVGGFVWISEGKEVENYTPIEVFARVVGKQAPDVDQYCNVVGLPLLSSFRENKVDIAEAVARETKVDDLTDHLDLWNRVNELCSHIRRWNSINE